VHARVATQDRGDHCPGGLDRILAREQGSIANQRVT
jgi:hypothetical protein